MKRTTAFLLACLALAGFASGHTGDSIPPPWHRNVIRINPTPALLFGNISNITLNYERLVKRNQSFVIQAGYLRINPLLEDTVAGLLDVRRVSDFGLNLSADYRFYPLRRAQYPAPDGLYIGPYLSYYGFKFRDEFYYNRADTVMLSGSYQSGYNFINLGLSLGYQFIFWKRLSVDLLLFGPSLTYSVSTWKVNADISQEEEEDLIRTIKEKFNEKFPLLVPFVKPNQGTKQANFMLFFRYSISIGFHF